MNGKSARIAAMVGMILVFASVILFMQIFSHQESRHWISLFFIALGEVLPIAGFIRIDGLPKQAIGPGLRVGIYSLFFVYGVAAVSMSIILLLLGVGAGMLATMEIVLLLGFAAILLFAAYAGAEKGRRQEDVMASVAFMRKLEGDVFALTLEPANQAYESQLRRIAEAVRYSNYAGRSGAEEAITEKLRELTYVLREGEGTAALDDTQKSKQVDLLTDDVLRLLKGRNQELLDRKKREAAGI